MKNYYENTYIKTSELKEYFLNISKGSVFEKHVNDLLIYALDNSMIISKIKREDKLTAYFYTQIKKEIESASTHQELEYKLMLLNMLPNTVYIETYKNNLIKHILENTSFNIETYCLMRHLMRHKTKQTKEVMQIMISMQGDSKKYYYQEAFSILCLEQDYASAIKYIQYLDIETNTKLIMELQKFVPVRYCISQLKNKKTMLQQKLKPAF